MEDDEHQGTILQQDQQGNLVPQPQINKLTAEDTEELIRNYHDVAVCTVLSYPSIGLGREVEGGLVLAGEECQGVRRGLVECGGGDT